MEAKEKVEEAGEKREKKEEVVQLEVEAKVDDAKSPRADD